MAFHNNTALGLSGEYAATLGPRRSVERTGGLGPSTEGARLAQPAHHAAGPLPLLYSLARDGSPWSTVGCAAQFVGKRFLDFAASTLGLLALSPLLLAVAVLIRLDSRGSPFFRQQRQGLGGKPFGMWKFRTMFLDAEARLCQLEHLNESQGGVLFKIRKDPRVTRVGRLLRRTSLDELPQLFNVLLGHMSLVGPRPLPLRDCELLRSRDEERYAQRLSVLPGLTGPWQVNGRSRVGIDEMLELDLDYIENWSLWWDLRLLARTFVVVLACVGSY